MRCLSLVGLLLSLACALGRNTPALAQPGHPRNAATWYQRAIDQIPMLSRAEWEMIASYDPVDGPPSPELRAALARAAPIISSFEQGSRQEYADFGLDRSQGIELLLPHLGQMRQIARAVNATVMVRLHDGNSVGASQLLATAFRATPHLGDDQTLISSLVAQSMFHLADGGVQHAIDRGAFGPGEAAMLLREAERLSSITDPFNYVGAAVSEQDTIVGWIEQRREEPEDVGRLLSTFFDGEDDREWATNILTMPGEDFDLAVAQYDGVMDRVVGIMQMDDPDAAKSAMASLDAEIKEGEHGPLMMLMPAWSRVLANKLRFEEALEKRIEGLRALALGEVEPEDFANAALWYLRAFEMIERLDPDWIGLLRQLSMVAEVAAGDEQTSGRALEPGLLLVQNILDVLHDGSLARRCDFSIVPTPSMALAPPYAGGMRDALRLVHADAMRHFRAGRHADAADRLAIGYRMIGHFAGDGHVASSIVAHRGFIEAREFLGLIVDEEQLQEDDHANIVAAVRTIDPGDAFGYIESRRRLLEHLRRAAAQHDRRAEAAERSPEFAQAAALAEELALLPTNVEIVNAADDDALLYYLAVLHYFSRPEWDNMDEEAEAEAEVVERSRWAALHDVFALDELMATRAEAPHVFGERWRNHDRGALKGLTVRTLSTLADRRHRARADLRATASRLRQDLAGPEPGERQSDGPESPPKDS